MLCLTVWIRIRPNILSGLIWVQTICKGNQQTEKVVRQRVNDYSNNSACRVIFHILCNLIFFQNLIFQKILSGLPSECQTVWIQFRPDILLGLIWVQTICKGYQQTAKVVTSTQRVNDYTCMDKLIFHPLGHTLLTLSLLAMTFVVC